MSFNPMRLTFDVPRGQMSLIEVEDLSHWVVGERYLWQGEDGESEDIPMHGYQAEQPLTLPEWKALEDHDFEGIEFSRVYDVLDNNAKEITLKHVFTGVIMTVAYNADTRVHDIQAQRPN